jgi:hypothetical protein
MSNKLFVGRGTNLFPLGVLFREIRLLFLTVINLHGQLAQDTIFKQIVSSLIPKIKYFAECHKFGK